MKFKPKMRQMPATTLCAGWWLVHGDNTFNFSETPATAYLGWHKKITDKLNRRRAAVL